MFVSSRVSANMVSHCYVVIYLCVQRHDQQNTSIDREVLQNIMLVKTTRPGLTRRDQPVLQDVVPTNRLQLCLHQVALRVGHVTMTDDERGEKGSVKDRHV